MLFGLLVISVTVFFNNTHLDCICEKSNSVMINNMTNILVKSQVKEKRFSWTAKVKAGIFYVKTANS